MSDCLYSSISCYAYDRWVWWLCSSFACGSMVITFGKLSMFLRWSYFIAQYTVKKEDQYGYFCSDCLIFLQNLLIFLIVSGYTMFVIFLYWHLNWQSLFEENQWEETGCLVKNLKENTGVLYCTLPAIACQCSIVFKINISNSSVKWYYIFEDSMKK